MTTLFFPFTLANPSVILFSPSSRFDNYYLFDRGNGFQRDLDAVGRAVTGDGDGELTGVDSIDLIDLPFERELSPLVGGGQNPAITRPRNGETVSVLSCLQIEGLV